MQRYLVALHTLPAFAFTECFFLLISRNAQYLMGLYLLSQNNINKTPSKCITFLDDIFLLFIKEKSNMFWDLCCERRNSLYYISPFCWTMIPISLHWCVYCFTVNSEVLYFIQNTKEIEKIMFCRGIYFLFFSWQDSFFVLPFSRNSRSFKSIH